MSTCCTWSPSQKYLVIGLVLVAPFAVAHELVNTVTNIFNMSPDLLLLHAPAVGLCLQQSQNHKRHAGIDRLAVSPIAYLT